MAGEVSAQPANPEFYFYLSHAPTSASVPDHWLRIFYEQLTREVKRQARSEMGTGFADMQVAGDDRDATVAVALNAARVLVPLYSPDYFAHPAREEATFRQRLALADANPAVGHIQPVLWEPLLTDDRGLDPDMQRALELGAGYEDYARLGLRSMCQLGQYQRAYREIVRKLATRIVDVAENAILAPTAARPLVEIDQPVSTEPHFVIAVIAPFEAKMPVRRERSCYGNSAVLWRPFRNSHDLPIAQYTARVATSLMLPTRIVDFAAGHAYLHTAPGVILIDPWMLAHPDGPALLRAAMNSLRLQWVTVMIVVDRNDPQYAARGMALADQALALGVRLRGLKQARDAAEFHLEISKAVTRTRQRFITRPRVPGYPPVAPPVPPAPPPRVEEEHDDHQP
jgi:FxsC-like protein